MIAASALVASRMFQSTPPVSRRRCDLAAVAANLKALFQSTPPVSRRRCRGG